MANKLGIDLAGKIVVMEGDCPESQRTLKVEEGIHAGFGARPELRGSGLFVKFWNGREALGESFRVSGHEVEKVVETNG